MSDGQIIACPHCQAQFELTPEYVEQYGGQETACSGCGNAVGIPKSWDELAAGPRASDQAPVLLSYRGPEFANKGGKAQHWAEGDLLVIQRDADLVPFCVLCGEDAPHPHVPFTARWSRGESEAPTARLGLLVSLFDTKKMRVKLGLCPKHRSRRRLHSQLALLCIAIGIAILFSHKLFPNQLESSATLPIGGIVFATGCFWLAARRGILEPVYVDRWKTKLKGASPKFLERLPERQKRVRPPDTNSGVFDRIE